MEPPKDDSTEFLKGSVLYREFLAEREEIFRHKWIESERRDTTLASCGGEEYLAGVPCNQPAGSPRRGIPAGATTTNYQRVTRATVTSPGTGGGTR